MLYLNKLLAKVDQNPSIFKMENIVLILGLTSTQIKNLKKYALENELIIQTKQKYFLTPKGKEFLEKNPLQSWNREKFSIRPEVNIELLKEEKTSPSLTKAIRLLAKHLLENQTLKEFSLEKALFEEYKNLKQFIEKVEVDILNKKKISLDSIYRKYLELGVTKPIISLAILEILAKNKERVAIYEKSQFQLKLDQLMFDRMMACPQNFELQKTELVDEYILKDVSKIILNKKSNNILEITKGLYAIIKNLDKYTMKTENLTKKTIRLRNIIVNAKDPMSLFSRDIPKVLVGKNLSECDREFLNALKISIDELKYCTKNLVEDLKKFVFDMFQAKSKEELCERFLAVKEFIGEKELKILFNNVVEIDVSEELWINRIATFINKSRVPKDWNDEDYADFKVKTKELALKFSLLETTVGTSDLFITKKIHNLLDNYLKLSKQEQLVLLRKMVLVV